MRKQGLYDPAFEHDACGVAFVARLDGTRSHETIAQALRALENLEHRGAAGADAETGDGAGILVQLPDAFLRATTGFELPPPGRYGVAVCFLPREAARRRELEQLLERTRRRRGPGRPRLARHPGRPRRGRRARQPVRAGDAPALRRRRGRARRRPAGVRAQALRDQARRRARGRRRPRDPELLGAHAGLQGDADLAAARALLPRPRRRADGERARPRALALLDEHLPELGARAPVPDDRAQRRDQHAARQRQLDPRARVAARLGALRRRHGRSSCRSSVPAAPTPRSSTTCSSCSCSRAARCRTR